MRDLTSEELVHVYGAGGSGKRGCAPKNKCDGSNNGSRHGKSGSRHGKSGSGRGKRCKGHGSS